MGLMGQAFIKNLVKAQIHVQGFDTDQKRMSQLKDVGGTPLNSPHLVGKDVDFVLTSLPNSTIARDVFFGDGGLADNNYRDLIVCDTTTSRPEDSEKICRRTIKFWDTFFRYSCKWNKRNGRGRRFGYHCWWLKRDIRQGNSNIKYIF